MKKLVVTMLTVLSCGAAYALPVGNPAEASLMTNGVFWEGSCADMCDPCASWCDAFSLRAGFWGYYVYDRHMFLLEKGYDVDSVIINTNAAYLALNAWNRVDLFATVGGSNFTIADDSDDWHPIGNEDIIFQMQSSTAFSWSIGSRATLWECGCATLGIEGQYFYARPNVYRFGGLNGLIYPEFQNKFKYQEWQVGLGISYLINIQCFNLVPYAALKWDQVKWDFNPTSNADDSTLFLGSMRNEKDWGYAVGITLVGCEKASLTVEADLANEKAVYANIQFRI